MGVAPDFAVWELQGMGAGVRLDTPVPGVQHDDEFSHWYLGRFQRKTVNNFTAIKIFNA